MKRFCKYEIVGFVFVSIVGSLFHFLYDWSGELTIIGLFCPVNESVWEHLKMLYFPFLIYSIYEYKKICRDRHNFWLGKYLGVLSGIITILAIHYIVEGAVGKSFTFVDVSSFFVGVLVAFLVSYAIISNNLLVRFPKWVGIVLMGSKIVEFVLYTFLPPFIPLFQDPTNSTFGI